MKCCGWGYRNHIERLELFENRHFDQLGAGWAGEKLLDCQKYDPGEVESSGFWRPSGADPSNPQEHAEKWYQNF